MPAGEDDIELNDPWGEEDAPDDTTVSSLIQDCKQTWLEYSMRYMAQAEYNERMVNGDQFIALQDSWQVSDDPDWPSYVPRTTRNLLRNLSLTWSSRLLEDRPWEKMWPAGVGINEQKARIANRLLEYTRQRNDIDDLCFGAAQLVQPHSAVGIKVVWDPLRGPPSRGVPKVDEATGQQLVEPLTGQPIMEGVGEPQGDVVWQLVSIFEYGTDGSEEIEDSKYYWQSKIMNIHDARMLAHSAGKDVDKITESKFKNIWGVDTKGVEVVELWWKPDYRFPRGLYCVQVGDVPVMAVPFPYAHNELPIAVWKCGKRRNSPYGSSHVDDAVYVQRSINEIVAALQQQARQIGAIKFIGHASLIEQWQNGNQMLQANDPSISQYARYLEPPPRSEVLVQSLEDNVQALYTLYGLNEILTGAENVKAGTSAKSIAYLNKLDSMKLSGAARSLMKALFRATKQTLKLYQQFVKAPRLIEILGGSQNDVLEFIGTDLDGVDLVMEPSSAIDAFRATKAADAQNAMMAGSMDPTLAQVAQTGIQDTAIGKASRDVVNDQIAACLRGEMQQADNEVDPGVAVMCIQQALASGQQNPALVGLMQQYQQRIMQMMPQMQQQQPSGEPQQ